MDDITNQHVEQVKQQVIAEVASIMAIRKMTRMALAAKLEKTPSAITQYLSEHTGLQLETLVRIAEALDCDVEVSLILRGTNG